MKAFNSDEQAVASVLARYQDTLNQADLETAMQLYAPDGVFMPPYSSSSVGIEAVRKAYIAVFEHIGFDVKFEIADIRQLAPEWILARTNSAGISTDKATGKAVPEANQELFLFQKLDGAWKIARYSFSTTNSPRV